MVRLGRKAKPAFIHDPSATGAFAALTGIEPARMPAPGTRAVVIGGGTGAPVSIRTLLSLGIETSAVVAMADDGGSTGILRAQAGATAPGDVRKCITAMAGDPDDPMTRAFKVRFTFAENHTLGNLMLSALEATTGSFPEAIAACERMLDARGHVYPSTLDRVTLKALTLDDRELTGQAVACHSRIALKTVRLEGAHHTSPIEPYEPALAAIRAADLIVLGPGSLFTSIISNLIVPGVAEAVEGSRAPIAFVCSLADMQGETWGMGAREHLEALHAHGLRDRIDYLIVHEPMRPSACPTQGARRLSAAVAESPLDTGSRPSSAHGVADSPSLRVRPVPFTEEDRRVIEQEGTRVIARDLVDCAHPTWHDPYKLREALLEVLEACPSRPM